MTACRCYPDPVDTSMACPEEAQNTVHGYAMCDACAAQTLKSTPLGRQAAPRGPIDFAVLLGTWRGAK